MRILIPVLASIGLLVGCSKDRTDMDPCAKAVANAERLVKADQAAIALYSEHPVSAEQCRAASSEEVNCVAYASDVPELERCSHTLLGSR